MSEAHIQFEVEPNRMKLQHIIGLARSQNTHEVRISPSATEPIKFRPLSNKRSQGPSLEA